MLEEGMGGCSSACLEFCCDESWAKISNVSLMSSAG